MSGVRKSGARRKKPRVAAGCLVVRTVGDQRQVLLVHPRGATFRKPLFGIPKGLVEEGEELAATALRETLEETGLHVNIIGDLGSVRQQNGKIVHAFLATLDPASESDIDEHGRCTHFDDENDVCKFYPIEQAESLMIAAQREFLKKIPEM